MPRITNVQLPDGRIVDVVYDDRKILRLEEGTTQEQCGRVDREVQDGKGRLVVPALVDTHVHFRVPGGEQKEDWSEGSDAAVHGGIGTVFDMPNTNPATTTVDWLDKKLELIGDPLVDFRLWFGATPDNLDQISGAIKYARVIGVKVYMGSTTGDLLVSGDYHLRKIFAFCAKKGVVVGVHAEDEDRIKECRESFGQKAKVSDHAQIRDTLTETRAVARALKLQKETGCRLYLCHLSTPESVELARRAKDQGQEVYVEVTPHHLWLSKGRLRGKNGAFFKMNPPLRSADQVSHLQRLVCEPGWVDTIGSDHAPHTREEKEREGYDNIPSGVPGVLTLFSLIYHFVSAGQMSLDQFMALTSGNAVRILGLESKGKIAPWADAGMVLVDPSQVLFDPKAEPYKCGWMPYGGIAVDGSPGLVVLQNGVSVTCS